MGHTLFAHTSYEPSSYTSRKDVNHFPLQSQNPIYQRGFERFVSEIAAAGADTFVAGSAIFSQPDYAAVISKLRSELANVG